VELYPQYAFTMWCSVETQALHFYYVEVGVSFNLRLLYPPRKNPRYQLHRKMGGPQGRSGCYGVKNPCRKSNPGRPARMNSSNIIQEAHITSGQAAAKVKFTLRLTLHCKAYGWSGSKISALDGGEWSSDCFMPGISWIGG
jgi:hypothetical protein